MIMIDPIARKAMIPTTSTDLIPLGDIVIRANTSNSR